jgi:hypothetical protein
MPLFWDLEDPDRYVYHYTNREAALGQILPTQQIRLGLFRYMNDPRESHEWLFNVIGDRGGSIAHFREQNREATRLAKSTAKVLATRRDASHGGEGYGDFGRGYAHSALWAHYGGGHSGVCLVFERERLHEVIKSTLKGKGKLYAGPVTYADAEPEEDSAFTLTQSRIDELGLEAAVEEHVAAWHPLLFFRKSREWENEREYRWLFHSSDPVPEFVPLADTLAAIVVGHDFPDGDRDSLERLSRVETATCRWDNGVPKIHHRRSTTIHVRLGDIASRLRALKSSSGSQRRSRAAHTAIRGTAVAATRPAPPVAIRRTATRPPHRTAARRGRGSVCSARAAWCLVFEAVRR